MSKNRIFGIIMIVIGIATLLWQLSMLRTNGSFYVLGALSSVIIVLGIASFFVDLSDAQAVGPDGKKVNLKFGDMPTGNKVALVLAILGGAAQLAFFKFGPLL